MSVDSVDAVFSSWPHWALDERVQAFRRLPRNSREDLYFGLSSSDQAELLLTMPEHERRTYLRILPPDDVADLVQEAPAGEREGLLNLLDQSWRIEVRALMAYAEDKAGGLMNPRFARLRPDMTTAEAIAYVRLQAREAEVFSYAYVLDSDQRLLGVLTLRALFAVDPRALVHEIMRTDLIWVYEDTDQEEVARLFARHDLAAIPVVDRGGHMKGVVTIDDIVHVVQEEATEDFQKAGGMEALQGPYLETGFWEMSRKRAGWLAALFLGEMLTATAMARYEEEIARAVVLAVFIPLIISSGGNSGSQASTLVIRAMALGEVRLRDWFVVAWREARSGVLLGAVLAVIGMFRIVIWETVGGVYGPYYLSLALAVGLSLMGVVLFGTLAGSMLPFILRRAGVDPASASAPFVATLVDVTGLVIYFTIARIVLMGTYL